jgi:hypothetical protein
VQTKRIFVAMFVAMALFGLSGCPDEDSNGGNGDAPAGEYLIEGYFGGSVMPGGFGLYVGRLEPDDPSASDCDVTLNGQDVSLRPLLSGADDAVYAILAYDYEPGSQYEIVVTLGGVSSTCSFTGPEFPWVTLEQPADTAFTPGDPIHLVWSYDDGTPDTVHISVTGGYDSDNLLEDQLAGSETSYTIAGSETAGWGGYSDILIRVDLGGDLWPFTGDLASHGSVVATIFTGDAATLYPN